MCIIQRTLIPENELQVPCGDCVCSLVGLFLLHLFFLFVEQTQCCGKVLFHDFLVFCIFVSELALISDKDNPSKYGDDLKHQTL